MSIPIAARPGVVAVRVRPCGDRRPVGECASCGECKTLGGRGLCEACRKRHRAAGTLGEFGWTKADRLAEYRQARAGGLTPHEAAARVGVARRTAWRYEAALRKAAAP